MRKTTAANSGNYKRKRSSTRGGKRVGAGRRPKAPADLYRPVSLRLPPAQYAAAERGAAASGVAVTRYLTGILAEKLSGSDDL